MFKKNTLLRALIAAGLTSGLVACGGGSSSSSSDGTSTQAEQPSSTTDTKSVGQFVDSPVQGLRYFTSSGSGVTTAEGEFEYKDGDEIFFLVGNTLIGQSIAGPVLTPLDVVGEAQNADKSMNILRFLQTLDENGDPSDGIVISDNVTVLAETTGTEVNFDLPADQFEAQTSVQNLVSEAGKDALVTAEAANTHFETTLSSLANNEVDIRGEWIATTVYKQGGKILCEGTATWTYTTDGLSVTGDELNPDTSVTPVDCGITQLNHTGAYESDALSDPGMGCTGGICTLDQLNKVIPAWDESTSSWTNGNDETINEYNYSVVELSHSIGSDTMRRIKTDMNRSTNTSTQQSNTEVWGVFETTFLKKEAAEYTKDMRGTWEVTSQRSTCPDLSVSRTITYSDTGISVIGEEFYVQNGTCTIQNINETLSYDDPGLPAEFCGPTCTYQELNGTYSDEGETIKLSHKRGTNIINRSKGLDSRSVRVKVN
ncbi:hypothetical protein DET50_102260 [Marinobacter pelagius]|uniref:Lipoprotein n=1 Tax=Marinobacter pelagius TaxID=379482 RepID=A0A366GXI0_9GAMM|nr:hypothetical protein [Marinobacter pelagius]RBP33445.1 hypothetical protein DET50_102260 [Marinobacter pelagius]